MKNQKEIKMRVILKILGTVNYFYRKNFSEQDVPHIYAISITTLIIGLNLISFVLWILIYSKIDNFHYPIKYTMCGIIIWVSVYLMQKKHKLELMKFIPENRDKLFLVIVILFTVSFFITTAIFFRNVNF